MPRKLQHSGFNGRTEFYHRSLGKSFVTYENEPALIIGSKSWTRVELGKELGCVHLAAAKSVTRILKEEGITNINELKLMHPEELLKIRGFGIIKLFVVMCALDAAGKNAEQWFFDQFEKDEHPVSAATLQHRARTTARAPATK